MRELSLQEVTHISGAADASAVDTFVQDGIKWVTSALGAFQGYATSSTAYPYVLASVDIGKYGLGGLGGAAGAVAGYVIGKLLSDYVVKPYA
ncbi:MAG TPA: hypothetical protein PLD88_00950 [Candidatus Berkiella sp.]|nr:hypothetical protein [Candidatus Berkiella sp.]